jgi:hypothetical protein
MNMIDGMRFWTPIFSFTDIKQFLLAHGLNIFKWVVAGGIFPKDEVEQQQLMYFKNKVFTITDNGYMYMYADH